MIPHVARGSRVGGLMTYLVGPGKRNEHSDPHLVAGDGVLMSWYDNEQLDHDSALDIARYLDQPHRAFGVDVNVGIYERQEAGRDGVGNREFASVKVGEKGGHIWHCSLAIAAEDGTLTDQQWGDIANDFVSQMGFDDHEGTKAPCRWVAVRHGALVPS